jgi:hypothetical protein
MVDAVPHLRPAPSRRVRDVLLGISLAVAAMLVALGVIELGFYVHDWRHPSTLPGFFWEPNADYGWGLTPGKKGRNFDSHDEFSTWVRINSRGLRDIEHEYDKPAGVYRVLVLGDSYMEALQVEMSEMFARRLHAELAVGTPPIEIINTGVSSFGTDNQLLFFRHEGYKYQPDLVLLTFTTANDIRENYEPFNREAINANIEKPTFSLDQSGALQLKPGPPLPPRRSWWRRHFFLGEWLYFRLGGTLLLPHDNPYGIQTPTDPKALFVAPDMFVYAPVYRPEVTEAWRVTEALVRELRREVEARGAKFAVVVNNGPWAHYDDRWRYMTMRHPIARDTWDRTKPTRMIDAFLSSQHIPFVDLYDAFEREKSRTPLYFKFDPHWRPAGHQLAAQTVAAFLHAERLVPGTGAAH